MPFASHSESVMPLVSAATSIHDVWTRLSRLYAKRSNSHLIYLKDKLSMMNSRLLFSYKFSDELTVLGDPPRDAELLLYSTHGLGPAYKELVAAIRARDTVVPFEELFSKITDQ